MSETQSPLEGTTNEYYGVPTFVGIERIYGVSWYIFLSTISLLLHLVFITGIRNLCGWNSKFCFTLLLILSLMCMLRFAAELVASITALFYLDLIKYQAVWIALGSIVYATYSTVVVLNIALTINRFVYTVFPFIAPSRCQRNVQKITLAAVSIYFIATVAIFNTKLLSVRWMDIHLSWVPMGSRNGAVLQFLNTLSNYGVGFINLVAYSTLIALLLHKKLISFTRNHEIKMTLQVFCTSVCEILFYVYWEFCVREDYAYDYIITETTNLLFFDVLVIPYIILNGNIHNELKATGKYITSVWNSKSKANMVESVGANHPLVARRFFKYRDDFYEEDGSENSSMQKIPSSCLTCAPKCHFF